MAVKTAAVQRVKIIEDTFISGVPIKEGAIVGPNERIYATEQDMKDLIMYGKGEEFKGQPEAAAGKVGK
jgi:hypothetical protein